MKDWAGGSPDANDGKERIGDGWKRSQKCLISMVYWSLLYDVLLCLAALKSESLLWFEVV